MSRETIERLVCGPFTRKQFAVFMLSIYLIYAGTVAIALRWPEFVPLFKFTSVVMVFATWIAFVKRIYDLGHNGFFGLVALVPILNAAALIYLLVTPTSRRGQTFCSCPKCNWHEWYRAEATLLEFCPNCKISLHTS